MTRPIEETYGMKRRPFARNIPVENLFENRQLKEAYSRITYTIEDDGFGVIIGDPGMGKSTLIRKLDQTLSREHYIVLYLSDSKLSPRWLYSGFLEKMGGEVQYYRYRGKRELNRLIQKSGGKKVIAIIDEAHLLDHEMLEECRFFLNDDFDSNSLASLFLVGQTELWDRKLQTPAYTAIRQRISCVIALTPLDRADTGRYIDHQLAYADGRRDLFTDKAIDRIYEWSGGTFRVINSICTSALLYGVQQDMKTIDQYAIDYVAEKESPAV